MAVYRQVHISFWQDPWVLELTPEEKYFYLYLMTNSKTRQCGCYEISKRVMCIETGYNEETVDRLLSRFIEYGKIGYCSATKEILLRNWLKYNSFRSPKVMICITEEVQQIKHKPFQEFLINRLDIDYIESIDTDLQEEEEQQEEQQEVISVPCPYEKIKALFNNTCTNLSPIRTISDNRKTSIKARWKQYGCEFGVFEELFTKAASSEFLCGENDRKWHADFDWLMNEHNMAKVLEGKYTGEQRPSGPEGNLI